ncbi:MAG: hypothetical protein DIZ78_06315 [endosymbiont of Escarpia spicata]|uniref:Metal-dependent phosphohydrolase n=1 Tax=endosymbiont of Escarpia spicata TaxID=2200908 RepID=A0A370DRZ4_9GAMM|nr:MAG: hypothetical protein DIZ78_06315 [endosymbiont of Escarpia spicata]
MQVSESIAQNIPASDSQKHSERFTRKRVRFPLQIIIGFLITLLLSSISLSISWYNFEKNKAITLSATQALFNRIERQTAERIQGIYSPAAMLVSITAELEQAQNTEAAQHQNLFHAFIAALRGNPYLASIYIGYADGKHYLVRTIRDGKDEWSNANLPVNTAFMVQYGAQRGDDQQEISYVYFDSNLKPVGRQEGVDSNYDPRQRSWYQTAINSANLIQTAPYIFFTTRDVGITLARRLPQASGVVAVDLRLNEISTELSSHLITHSTEVVVFNSEGTVIAYSDVEQVSRHAGEGDHESLITAHLSDLHNPVLHQLLKTLASDSQDRRLNISTGTQEWIGTLSPLPLQSGETAYLEILSPHDELLAPLEKIRAESVQISLALLSISILIGWWISRRISLPIHLLAQEAREIRKLKLDTPIDVHSHINEIHTLSETMSVMKASIQQFIEIGKALSTEKNMDHLLEKILLEAQQVCNADAGSICLLNDDEGKLEFSIFRNDKTNEFYGGSTANFPPFQPIFLSNKKVKGRITVTESVVRSGKTLALEGLSVIEDSSEIRQRFERKDYQCITMLALPLINQRSEIIGVLELINARQPTTDELIGFSPAVISFVEALSSSAAIALDNRRLLKEQKDLLDAVVQMLAGAIDAKSHYTSGHCQRVPILAHELAIEATLSTAAPFRDFTLSEEQWYELYLASWLHDCGKVTTPEYVVDKATKLETIYNRIHKIRLRFELLWRDAEINYLKALSEGDNSKQVLQERLNTQTKKIREDYAFVAECNIGEERMAAEKISRLNEIATQTWRRNLDDRLGISPKELSRKVSIQGAQPTLPTNEPLLANKTEHIIPHRNKLGPFADNPYGFQMDAPKYAFNLGELYNLSTEHGTLTKEERFKINEHIVQTIIMLKQLPFPKALRHVPDWAGSHHEKLDGSGYPRHRFADSISIPERIMTIADIFEALTASDRPYKKSKSVSTALKIMAQMSKENKICPHLYELFLTSGAYSRYADEYLLPEQIDKVDIAALLS